MCHAGRPEPAPGTADPASPFGLEAFEGTIPPAELSVGCENCHGPGSLHIKEREAGAPVSGAADTAIVNPARLSPGLADNICMRCHQAGDARVLMPGKTLFDFRPGTPLGETLAIFQVPLNRDSPPPSPLLSHYFGLSLSQCYLKSGGRMSCLTCHDPRVQPPPAQAPDYFRSKCLSCHTEKSCTLPHTERMRSEPADNCIGCHMPKQTLSVISHAALTNHRVAAKAGEPYPDAVFRLTTPELPDLVEMDPPAGSKHPPSDLILFQAYEQLVTGHPGFIARYLTTLDKAASEFPDNPFVLSADAQGELWTQKPDAADRAIRDLSRAVKLGSRYPLDYLRLAQLLSRANRPREAVEVLKQGISVAPYDSDLYQMLASQYWSLGDRNAAVETVRDGLEKIPDNGGLRRLGEQFESAGGGR